MTQPASSSAAAAAAAARTLDALATALIAFYTDAEQRLLADLTSIARRGLHDPSLAARALMHRAMVRAAHRTATELRTHAGPLAQRIAERAAADGQAAARADLERLVRGHSSLAALYLRPGGHATAAANTVALDLGDRLTAVAGRVLRFADDAYQAAVARATSSLVLGHGTPETAQLDAWRELMAQGVTGFRDRAGRRWNLASYVEVATRTATQRAFNAAHLDRMTAVGIQYFTVPHDGHPCPLCRPWEGAVLSAGRVGVVTAQAADSDRLVAFTVNGTIEEARAAGLWHPNCRHVLQAYLPGVTKTTPAKAWTADDQARYVATQQLRALERIVREGKREYGTALDEFGKRRAMRKIRAAQARIRAHVEQHDLVRRPRREQINLGHT